MLLPTAHTRAYAVLGRPVRHSLSPALHNPALRALGLDAVYLAFEVGPERLGEALAGLAALGFGGVNCTIPLKEEAFRLVHRRDPSAEWVGAVNTIAFTPEGLVGHNTDGYGVEQALREAFGVEPAGTRFALLGCGGAGRGVALHLARAGAAALTLWNRTPERAQALAEELRRRAPGVAVEEVDSPRDPRFAAAEVVLQCTAAGMGPEEESPAPPAAFRPGQRLLDTIYVHAETPTMRAARAAGAQAVNGLGMLLHQGVRALEIWTGRPAPVAVMRAALQAGLEARKA
jgi:shikimate dehydrogenase